VWEDLVEWLDATIRKRGPIALLGTISVAVSVSQVASERSRTDIIITWAIFGTFWCFAILVLLLAALQRLRTAQETVRRCSYVLSRYFNEVRERSNVKEYSVIDWSEEVVIHDRSGNGDSSATITMKTGNRPVSVVFQSRKYVSIPGQSNFRYRRKVKCSATQVLPDGRDGPSLPVKEFWDAEDGHRLRFFVFFDPALPGGSTVTFRIRLHVPVMGLEFFDGGVGSPDVRIGGLRHKIDRFAHSLVFKGECRVGDRVTATLLVPERENSRSAENSNTGVSDADSASLDKEVPDLQRHEQRETSEAAREAVTRGEINPPANERGQNLVIHQVGPDGEVRIEYSVSNLKEGEVGGYRVGIRD
jgi:hypothetical protein